jgi:hypothetical protein
MQSRAMQSRGGALRKPEPALAEDRQEENWEEF